MKAFIYTLTATLFVAIALTVLLIVSNSYYKDNYSNTLLVKYLGINTLNAIGVNIYYDNGTVIEEKFPHKDASEVFDKIKFYYSKYEGVDLNLTLFGPLEINGPVNYTHENSTIIKFDGDAEITINCGDCNVTENLTVGSTHYKIKIVTSNQTYNYDGDYNGVINSSNFELNLYDSKFELIGDNITASYRFPVEGTFLSNIRYSIILGNLIHGYLNVRT